MDSLEIKDISKAYILAEGEHQVLQGLSFTAELGKITVLLGKSGCGKTTLLRLISGLEEAGKGSLNVPKGLRIGMMFQEARLMPWLTCRENVTLGLEKNFDSVAIDELLHTVGLSKFADAYPHQLSGGMQQRAALARTLAQKSEMILMDEPFAALDYFTRLQMQQEVLRIKAMLGTGIIFVTHNIDEALALGDKILILQEGTIAQEIILQGEGDRDILQEPYLSYKKQILRELIK